MRVLRISIMGILSVTASRVDGQSVISRYVMSEGGGDASSASLTLQATLGEPAIGDAVSASHALVAGFWRYCTYAPCGPAVEFVAVPGPGRVLLRWRTSLEAGVSGYVVHRATGQGGVFAPLLSASPTGPGIYERLDSTTTPGMTYDYRLYEQYAAGPLVLRGTAVARPYGLNLPPNVVRVGPNGSHPTIGAAIAGLAGAETVITVEPGTYPAFTVAPPPGTSLRVIGDGTGPVIVDASIGPVLIHDTDFTKTVELRNLEIRPGSIAHASLQIVNCQGPVILDSLAVEGGTGRPGASLVASTAVTFQRCHLTGTPGLDEASGSAAYVSRGSLEAVAVSGASTATLCQVIPGSIQVSPDSTLLQLPGIMPDIDLHPFFPTGSLVNLRFEASAATPWFLAFALGTQWTPLPGSPTDMVLLLDSGTLTALAQSTTDAAGRDVFQAFIPGQVGFEGLAVSLQALAYEPSTGSFRFSNVSTMIGLP